MSASAARRARRAARAGYARQGVTLGDAAHLADLVSQSTRALAIAYAATRAKVPSPTPIVGLINEPDTESERRNMHDQGGPTARAQVGFLPAADLADLLLEQRRGLDPIARRILEAPPEGFAWLAVLTARGTAHSIAISLDTLRRGQA
jgi:hypothetical protein